MLEIPVALSTFYGLAFSSIAEARDAGMFDVGSRDLTPYIEVSVQVLAEEARDHRELGLVQKWLEFLLAVTHADIEALGLGNADSIADIVLPIPGADLRPEEWHRVLQLTRHRLFGVPPMTDEEKAAVKREVTIVDSDLAEFRARMKAEGRLDPE